MQKPMFVQDVNGLDDIDIVESVPSVFATSKHESRSGRYTYIPTSLVLKGLRDAGFVPTTAMQSRSRVENKQDFTKHLLRLRRIDDLGYSQEDVHEIVLVNSHDGTSAYNLYGGIFRTVCTNGLITGSIDSTMKVYHKGNIVQEVVDSTLQLAEESESVMAEIEAMKHVELRRPEQLLLAEFGLKARFDLGDDEEEQEGQSKAVVPYQPQDFLRVRRMEDYHNDLYTTMNIVQENAIKGGVRSSRRDDKGRRHTARAIHGIDQSTKVNRLLWQFSERLLEFKQG